MKIANWKLTILAAVIGSSTACGESTSNEDEPCGIRICAEGAVDGPVVEDEPFGGKADADDIRAAVADLTSDGVLDADDVRQMFDEAGNRINLGEMLVIHEAVHSTDWEVTEDANSTALSMARTHGLSDTEVERVEAGISFAGTEVPEEVQALVARARLAGAVAYDVTERKNNGEGKWTDYPATAPAEGNMAWDYTMLTPEAIFDDMNDTTVRYNAIVGSETGVTSSGQEYKQAKYEERTGGTGNVMAHYDEVYHPDLYARGYNGQKWASNFGILSDGSIHALPASRRSVLQDVILTNPALSRGAHMMYHGHITIREGLVTDVELSGRLSKRAAEGKTRFINPLALLEAWGFEIEDGLRVRWGNTSEGAPQIDDELDVIIETAQ